MTPYGSDPPPAPDPEAPAEAPRKAAPRAAARARSWFRAHTPLSWAVEAVVVAALVLGMLMLAARYGPLTPEARLLIEARASGLALGPYGKLKLEGIGGDIWGDFTVRRVMISDDKGVWLEADHLAVKWRAAELLRRRLHVQSVSAGRLLLLRQPHLGPSGPPAKAPAFSYQVDAIAARVEMTPQFALRRGLYDLNGGFDVENRGATRAKLAMESVLRPGDHLRADIDVGKTQALLVDADVVEVQGGALAGSLGLPADQSFVVAAHVSGTMSNGRLAVIARSGATTPIQAQGAWSPGGGALSAHVLMAASSLTRGWVNQIGQEAQLSVVGRRDKGDVYDFDGRLVGSNLTLVAKGPADVAHRSTKGMGLSLVVNDLKKVWPWPAMGRGQFTGVLAGAPGDLRITSSADVQNLEFAGYRLARASGPLKLTWAKGELSVLAQPTGSGGGGVGPIAAAGGPSPKATAEVVRLKDSRVLVRSLDFTGAGIKIQGTGGQTFLGQGLSFKGAMQAADLAQVRKGAAGALQASWSATQASGQHMPWTFTVDGRGARFASGWGELDRLLGPEPHMTITAAYADGTFNIAHASLEGAKGQATGQGTWPLGGDLGLAIAWQAAGPFTVGPMEIDGKAHGTGAVTGPMNTPKVELAANFDSIAFPQMAITNGKLDLTFSAAKDGTDGTIALGGQSVYGPAKARSAFRFMAAGMDLTGLDADAGGVRAKGSLSLRNNGGPSAADLTVALGPGAVLTEGQASGKVQIVNGPGGARASLNLQAKGAVLRGQPLALASASVTADGPLSRLPYKISADGAWLRTPLKLAGAGFATQDDKGYAVSFEGSGQLRRSPFKTLEPIQVRMENNTDRSAKARLSLGGGQAMLDAHQVGGELAVRADMSGVDLSFLSEDFTGQLDGHLLLDGRGAGLHGTLDAAIKDARSRDARKGLSIDGTIKAALADNRVTLDANLTGGQGLAANVNLTLPAEASAAPFRIALARTKPMQGRFTADGEIQPVWDLFLGGERTLGGKLAMRTDIAGTLADPRVTGRVDLTDGRFDDYPTGLKLRQLAVGAALNGDAISVDRLQASDPGKGAVSGSGQVSLARGGGGNFVLDLNAFRLVDNDTAQADATGKVTVTRGADGKAKIAGALELVRGEINAAARTGSSVPTIAVTEKNRPFHLEEQVGPAPAANQPGVALDVALNAKRGVLVKGRGLDLDMSLNARVTGTTSKPVFDGDAHVVRGDYQFAGKRFEFDNRGVVHLSNDPNLIRLDLTATREDVSLTAVIKISGTAARPQITLSSTPVLPNDEVLSQVLFGQSASQLSPLEAAQLASALTSLAAGGGFDVIGGLRNFARLDRLALAGGGQTAVTVSGGKYIRDNLYVELTGGSREGIGAELEYRVTHNLSLVTSVANPTTALVTTVTDPTTSQINQLGGTMLSVRWRQDFGRPKPTPP